MGKPKHPGEHTDSEGSGTPHEPTELDHSAIGTVAVDERGATIRPIVSTTTDAVTRKILAIELTPKLDARLDP